LHLKIVLGVIIVGLALAIYHSYDEIVSYSTKASQACHINSLLSCSATFAYSHPFGVPLYVFGLIWFPLLLIITLIYRANLRADLMLLLLVVGDMFTIYLWYLEAILVYPNTHAVCPVCVSMYVINYILTALMVIEIL
jgi:uncharacterized membrane protein